jgi:hypothetical protein
VPQFIEALRDARVRGVSSSHARAGAAFVLRLPLLALRAQSLAGKNGFIYLCERNTAVPFARTVIWACPIGYRPQPLDQGHLFHS